MTDHAFHTPLNRLAALPYDPYPNAQILPSLRPPAGGIGDPNVQANPLVRLAQGNPDLQNALSALGSAGGQGGGFSAGSASDNSSLGTPQNAALGGLTSEVVSGILSGLFPGLGIPVTLANLVGQYGTDFFGMNDITGLANAIPGFNGYGVNSGVSSVAASIGVTPGQVAAETAMGLAPFGGLGADGTGVGVGVGIGSNGPSAADFGGIGFGGDVDGNVDGQAEGQDG